MEKITVEVSGMMCGMCEAHINDAVRKAFPDVEKVNSSRAKNQTEIISKNPLDEEKLKTVIADTGYEVGAIRTEPYEKKGLFGFLHKYRPKPSSARAFFLPKHISSSEKGERPCGNGLHPRGAT